MFYQIIDLGERSPNYLETSGSLLVSYAMLKASRLEIILLNIKKLLNFLMGSLKID